MSCTQCKVSVLENDEDDTLEIGYLYHLEKCEKRLRPYLIYLK